MRFKHLVIAAAALCAGCAHAPTLSYDVQRSITDPSLLKAQRDVWVSWFAGDTATLRKLTPGLVTMDGEGFVDQEQTIKSSAQYHAGGGPSLKDLNFTDMRVQRFGNVAVVYSLVEYMTNGANAKKRKQKATEIFVFDHGTWVNPGWHLENVQ